MSSQSRGFARSFGLALLSVSLISPSLMAVNPPAAGPAYPAAPQPCAPMVAGACCNPCCGTCGQPPDICTCTTYKPVCDTCYRTQPIVGYHDVCRTCYRQEPYCVTVPVTKVDCVTVDEGCYKMVWCPKPVTKQVPRVEYHQQVCNRTVPYTVTQRVPHVTTQVVPEYRVRYVPQTHTYVKPPCPTCCPTPAPPGCGCPLPMSQSYPNGYPSQSMASVPAAGQQQLPPLVNPAAMTPNVMGPHGAGGLQQAPFSPASIAPSQNMVASTGAPLVNPYVRSQPAGSIWQANRGVTAQ